MKKTTRVAWSARETERFLLLQEAGKKGRVIAKALQRTLYSIQGVRRKLPKARKLAGRSRKKLVGLLLLNEGVLKKMRKAKTPPERGTVKAYRRRSGVYIPGHTRKVR